MCHILMPDNGYLGTKIPAYYLCSPQEYWEAERGAGLPSGCFPLARQICIWNKLRWRFTIQKWVDMGVLVSHIHTWPTHTCTGKDNTLHTLSSDRLSTLCSSLLSLCFSSIGLALPLCFAHVISQTEMFHGFMLLKIKFKAYHLETSSVWCWV